jgi:hypothetical protein
MSLKKFGFYLENVDDLRELLLEYSLKNELSMSAISRIVPLGETVAGDFLKKRRGTSRTTIMKIYNFLKKQE